MHIVIIPSEEFLPKHNHLSGIFQKHQALALQKAGCKVGILSVRQSLSIPMLLKALLFRFAGKEVKNELNGRSAKDLIKLIINKTFYISKFITKEKIDGLEVFRINGFYFLPPCKHSNHFGWLRAGVKLWEYYCDENGTPDIIHAHNAVYAGFLANKISNKTLLPYVITEHSSFIARNLESPVIKRRIKRCYMQSSSFFTVSDFLGKKIEEVFSRKYKRKILPNVLDPQIEEAPIHECSSEKDSFKFIAIGSLIPLKRHKDLVQAFYEEFNSVPHVRLTIAGDGELKETLQQQINVLGLHNQVKLTDRLQRNEIIELIDECECLVLCSEIETFGVVLIEAISRGKPVIASKCGGPEDIVNAINGVLYPVGDIKALSAAMIKIKNEYNAYERSIIRSEALKKYGGDFFAAKLKKEYMEIIQ